MLVCLALDTQFHDQVSANGTGVHLDIPAPQSDTVPLFDLDAILFRFVGAVDRCGSGGRGLGHGGELQEDAGRGGKGVAGRFFLLIRVWLGFLGKCSAGSSVELAG